MPIVTIVLIVLTFAIIAAFSQDLKKIFKAVFEYKSAKIFLPLMLASTVLYVFNDLLLLIILDYQFVLTSIIYFVSNIAPSSLSQPIAAILVLTLIAVLPVMGISYMVSRKSYIPYRYPYLTSSIIWIISAMVWIIR